MSCLNRLGVALTAVLALAAVSAASAQAGNFTWEALSVTISGASNSAQKFNLNGAGAINEVTCNSSATNGSTEGVGSAPPFQNMTQSMNVAYSSCSAFLGIAANVSSASYTFNVLGNSNHVGIADINNNITITIGSAPNACTATIGAQGSKTNVEFNAPSSEKTITIEASITNLNSNGSGGACGSAHASGTYKGMSTWSSSSKVSYS